MIEQKTELELLREQLEECRKDLYFMGSPEGQPALIAANIRHKQAQARKLAERIREIEGGDPSPSAQDDSREGREAPPWA